MSEIRTLAAEDIPAVADLFQKVFVHSDSPAPSSLASYMREAFLDHPEYDPEIASRVFVDDAGRIRGFIGIHPSVMSYAGERVRAAVSGTLMVDKPEENPTAGARLLRSVVNGPQDISISETANPLSATMWEKLGGRPVPALSLEWIKLLRPAGAALALTQRKVPLARFSRPLWSAIDLIATRVAGDYVAIDDKGAATDEVVDAEFLKQHLPAFAERYPLHPDWTPEALGWLLKQSVHKERYGDARAVAVYDRRKAVVGAYIYHFRRGDFAHVLQVLAAPGAADAVLGSLLRNARDAGAVAVRGRAQPFLMDALMRQRCIFLNSASTMVHSRRPELLDAVLSGGALVNGLAGETWTRLIGGRFA